MRAAVCILCLAFASGCLAPPEDPTFTVHPTPPPPPPPPPPGPLPEPPPPPPPDGACGPGTTTDPGGHGGFPGSGLGVDGGTAQLWFVRIDRGTANLATPIQSLVQNTTSALRTAGLQPRGIAVVSLYQGDLVWVTTDVRTAPILNLSAALKARAELDNPPAAGCATSALLGIGSQLLAVFPSRPGALLVGVVDHGARPLSLASCGANTAATLAKDPGCWASFGSTFLHRADFRFAFFATAETGTTADMKASCLRVPGFPTEVLDALEASDAPYYDPLADAMDREQPDLATRFDLCAALGSDAPERLGSFAGGWARVLMGQP
jgi:hypothetical protein